MSAITEEGIDFVRTGPGTLAGRYLRMYWQPVYRASDLPPGRAVPLRILGEELTLYRGKGGEAHVVAFRCAHRGTQLNVGWVEGDCIRCRYHGWMYDGSGQCVEQPGEDASFASKVRIRSYPTLDYLGLVFAYLGEGDPPPPPHFPDFDAPGVLETDPPEVWPCNFWNRLDNDPAHVVWTHRQTYTRMGNANQLVVRDVSQYVETDYGIGNTYPDKLGPARNNHFLMPNVNLLCVATRVPGFIPQRLNEFRLIFHLPVDDGNCIAFDVNLTTNLFGAEADRYRVNRREVQETDDSYPYEAAERILAGKMAFEDVDPELSYYQQFWIEDYVTQVGQGLIADRSDERLIKNDVRVVLKRRLWQRELKALDEGRPLKQWTRPLLYADSVNPVSVL